MVSSYFIKKGKEENIKIPSSKYCRTCNLFLCEECLKNHQKKNSHELIELYNLKPNYCNKHNQKFLYYCHKCDKNICNNCLVEHNNHNIKNLEKITLKQKRDPLEIFIEYSEDMKNNKYSQLYKNIIWLKNFKKNEKESKNI